MLILVLVFFIMKFYSSSESLSEEDESPATDLIIVSVVVTGIEAMVSIMSKKPICFYFLSMTRFCFSNFLGHIIRIQPYLIIKKSAVKLTWEVFFDKIKSFFLKIKSTKFNIHYFQYLIFVVIIYYYSSSSKSTLISVAMPASLSKSFNARHLRIKVQQYFS